MKSKVYKDIKEIRKDFFPNYKPEICDLCGQEMTKSNLLERPKYWITNNWQKILLNWGDIDNFIKTLNL